MEEYKIYLAGKFVQTNSEVKIFNPYHEKAFAKTYLAGKQELEEAIISGQKVLKTMRDLPSYERYDILMQIAQGLSDNLNEIAQILSDESGKPMRYAKGEIQRSIQTFTVAAEEAKRLPAEVMSLDWTAAGKGKQGVIRYFPVGLVAGISPFNFPMNLAVHKIAPAIAAGCPIILKPSTTTPLSTLALAKIIDKTSLPKGAISILPMSRAEGNQLVTDDRFKLLSFTGSPHVGWLMKAESGRKKVVLELGGNAGMVITKSADLDLAVEKAIIGGFAYSGQVCIHAQRIYVAQEIFEEFAHKFVSKVKNLKVGDPTDDSTEISAMIDENNAKRVEAWVNEAIHDGAKVLCGGNRHGTYYEPTILSDTKPKMKVCALEVFGPVVTLEPFSDFESVIDEVNESEFGLQAGVFTNQIDEMDYAFTNLEVGGVIINDSPIFRVDHMPYGGIKDSGLGREGVKYAIHDMMEARILVR
ncbi:MAG: aldehyde dehydrogenase family protein [Bacteroidales bacterium]|nr:aldehyde dehydrogenase family protein [Bacteroidales bacterium]